MRLPEPRALRLQAPVAVSAAVHLAVILWRVWETGRPPATVPSAPPGPAGGGGRRVEYLSLPPYRAPAPPDQTRPQPLPSRPIMRAEVQDITPTTSVADVVPATPLPGALQGGAGAGTGVAGIGTPRGTGAGSGAGPAGGSGEAFPPQARYSILPPLPKPASVRGKSFRVRFWVSPTGRVTRVDVSPPIPDPEYRKRFIELMYQYTFTPAMRPDGTPVAGQAILTITL
ncbi:MAG: hypothetical protein HYW06_12745 [Gemmatimonadetes bacterium]|nr:hypothetical protein [Gemmatimonadota bacterium]